MLKIVLGIIYLLSQIGIGWYLTTWLFRRPTLERSINLRLGVTFLLPSAIVFGIVFTTSLQYYFARVLEYFEIPGAFFISQYMVILAYAPIFLKRHAGGFLTLRKFSNTPSCIRMFGLFGLLIVLFFFERMSFSQSADTLLFAKSATGDLHAAIVRSLTFSEGGNLVTMSPLAAGEPARYHFFFFFWVANFISFDWAIDWAFNVPSALSMFSLLLLVCELSRILWGKAIAAFIGVFLFAFRSSFTFWILLLRKTDVQSYVSRFYELWNSQEFLSATAFEGWGIWTWNVYANQRHLPLAMALFVLVLFYWTERILQTNPQSKS